ncbi:MAG: hypothetical protein ABSF70_08060 [Terracidiphilus sp.]
MPELAEMVVSTLAKVEIATPVGEAVAALISEPHVAWCLEARIVAAASIVL